MFIDWLKINLNSLWRTISRPLINYIIAIEDSKTEKIIDYWSQIKNYPPGKFSEFINNYKWIKEPVDFDIITPNQFFMNRAKSGRECNNFAKIWKFWGLENGYKPYTIMVQEAGSDESHMICVLYKNKIYYLCNYTWTGKPYYFLDDAILEIAILYKYKNPLHWSYAA
jgi:hypothetical protein